MRSVREASGRWRERLARGRRQVERMRAEAERRFPVITELTARLLSPVCWTPPPGWPPRCS